MISYIVGEVAEVFDGAVVIECGGLGYFVHVSNSTISKLRKEEGIKLFTHMQMRENDVGLIGFLSREEVRIFGMLTSVSGVGTKAALAIQSVLDTSQIILAILSEDEGELCRAQGVGKKLAQRIVLELRDKLKSSDEQYATAVSPQQSIAHGDIKQDAADALLSLGYSRGEALRAVMEVALDGMSTEQIIRNALKKLST